MKHVTITMLVFILVCLFSGACDDNGSDGTTDPVDPPTGVALIYHSDSAWVADWAALLTANDFAATRLSTTDVSTADLSGFDVLFVESRTGNVGDWYGDSTAVENIRNSGKPILAAGFGGACLLWEMGDYDHNWMNGANLSDTTGTSDQACHIKVMAPDLPIFTTPIPFHIPADSIIEVYTQTALIEQYAPETGDTTLLLGQDVVNNSYYPLTAEGNTVLWGFTNGPDRMTRTGKDLIVNIVKHLAE